MREGLGERVEGAASVIGGRAAVGEGTDVAVVELLRALRVGDANALGIGVSSSDSDFDPEDGYRWISVFFTARCLGEVAAVSSFFSVSES